MVVKAPRSLQRQFKRVCNIRSVKEFSTLTTHTSIFNHTLISQRYFFPRPDSPSPTFLHKAKTSAGTLNCAYINQDAEYTIIYFHGNGELVSDYVNNSAYVNWISSFGANVFFFEFRGYGGSEGTPGLVSMFDDISPAMESLNLQPEKCILYGRSVGSIYSIEACRQYPNMAGLVLESAVSNPLERVLKKVRKEEMQVGNELLEKEKLEFLDHRMKMRAFKNPTLVLHGLYDSMVSATNAEKLHKWSGAEMKHICLFHEGDHNTLLQSNFPAYTDELSAFIDKVTGKLDEPQ